MRLAMGLARDLSMGTRRRSGIARGGVWDTLRALLAVAEPDPERLESAIRAVGATRARMRFAEGALYNDACARYLELTGRRIGPATGTY